MKFDVNFEKLALKSQEFPQGSYPLKQCFGNPLRYLKIQNRSCSLNFIKKIIYNCFKGAKKPKESP